MPVLRRSARQAGRDGDTLESIPRQWKVIQTVHEKSACRARETITQPPAPFHPIARAARVRTRLR
jgi:transposase